MRGGMLKGFIWVLVIFNFSTLIAQIKNIGAPYIHNYYPEDYNADTKSWDVLQDSIGLMYFANHFGVLQFNGSKWDIIALPDNRTFVRSIKFDINGTLYVGSQNEIGFITKHKNGQYEYESLVQKIPEKYRNFGDIWQIFPVPEAIYFLSYDYILKYNYDKFEIINPKSFFSNGFMIDHDIYLIDKNFGLYSLNNNSLKLISDLSFFKNNLIVGMFKHDNKKILVSTDKKGLYWFEGKKITPVNSSIKNFFKTNVISTGNKISNNYYAFGTLNNGVIILDKNCEPVQHLNTNTGLQNNTIISIYNDRQENLWICTGNGIDYALLSSPFTMISKMHNLNGEIYNTIISDKHIYFATLEGIGVGQWNSKYNPVTKPLQIKNIDVPKNIVWQFSTINNMVLASHHSGAGIINQNIFNPFHIQNGIWSLLKISATGDTLLAGNYKGFQLLIKNKDKWKISPPIKGFDISSRIFEKDRDNIYWMAHGYQGIYKIEFNEKFDSVKSYKLFTQNNGLPSNLFNNLFKINNEVVFGTEKGVYKYDAESDSMVIHEYYEKIFGKRMHVRLLKEDENNNLWYIIGEEGKDITGYITKSKSGTILNTTTPFQVLHGKHIPGFENIYFHNNHVFVGTKNGVIHYNSNHQKDFNWPYNSCISKVYLQKSDSVLYGNTLNDEPNKNLLKKVHTKNILLPSKENDIIFYFSALFYEFPDKNEYAYILEGYNNTWSDWSNNNSKEYTNLPGGSYTFKVKAKNIYGVESAIDSFAFEIDKPYYLKSWAYASYISMVVLLVLLLNLRFRHVKKKLRFEEFKKQEAILLEKKRNEIEAENLIYKLEQDKLQEKLSSFTMSITKKNELFKSLQKRIEKLIYISKPEVSKQLKEVLFEIEKELENESQWEEFQIHFNRTHQDFLNRFQKQYSELTTKDLKFCAYIRMKLSPKEIISLMNITIRGVEAARLRIRKKLKFNKDTHLDDFIMRF